MFTATMIVLNTLGAAAHSDGSIVKVISTIQEVSSNCELSGAEFEMEREHVIKAAKLANKHILPHMDKMFASLMEVYDDVDAFEDTLNHIVSEHSIDVASMILESNVFMRSVSSDLTKRLSAFEMEVQKRGREGEIDLEALSSSKSLRVFVNKGSRFINELATLVSQVTVRHVPDSGKFLTDGDIKSLVAKSHIHFHGVNV